jgi:hypothetical protein
MCVDGLVAFAASAPAFVFATNQMADTAARAAIFNDHINGAGCRNRTRDPLITNQVLYHLS